MTPITRDPKRRIRRIQRWLRNVSTEFNGLPCYVACHRIESKENCGCFEEQRYECAYCAEVSRRLTSRIEKADSLLSLELAWLCDYALRITADHGRATSRLGETEMALRRIGAAVHSISPRVSPRSTPDTLVYEVESACRIVEDARTMKKRG